TRRTELGVAKIFPTGAFQIDRGRLENFLLNDLCDVVQRGAKIAHVEEGEPHRVNYTIDGEKHVLSARWVIDATGRSRLMVRQKGLQKITDHPTHAVWFRIPKRIAIDQWGDDAWRERILDGERRWLSTNHLAGTGYWVWIIPLPDNLTSIGIVADARFHALNQMDRPHKAMGWIEKHEPQLFQAIAPTEFLDFKVLNHYAHHANQVFFPNRLAITGEAGLFLDPFYSPGSDFIALANEFIFDLIQQDLAGQSVPSRANIYNQLFISYYDQTLPIYQNQYRLFGHSSLMSLKVIWDYALYWSTFAFLFIQERFTDLVFMGKIQKAFLEVGSCNQRVQHALNQWSLNPPAQAEGVFINKNSLPWLAKLNADLTLPLDFSQAQQVFSHNLNQLQQLHDDIIAVSQGRPTSPLLEPVLPALFGHSLTLPTT
ncbi:MAG: tryptophan 7-halogenase, partial [Acidobacteria bacterium]|nr:tryptophan 7-halogenase [Acidobacteriota bacterium]